VANDADLIDAVHAPPENAQKSVLSYALYLRHRESRLREEDARWDESFGDPEKLARFNCRAAQSTLSSEMAFSEWLSYVSGVMQSTTFGGIIHSDPEIMGGTPARCGWFPKNTNQRIPQEKRRGADTVPNSFIKNLNNIKQ